MAAVIADVVRAVVTLALVGTCAFLWATGGGPPAELSAVMGLCLGSYFGKPTLVPKP